MERLTQADIRRALEALAAALPATHPPRELWIVGGAALVLLYAETTKDVDGIALGAAAAAELRAAAGSVAASLGLPADWLNDGAKGYLHGLAPGEVLFSRASLVVRSVAPRQLLAMKLSAWRDDLDVSDARLLLSKLPGDKASVWQQVEPYLVPGRQLRAQYAFDDHWEADRGSARPG
jgi:hypothetical protein